MDYQHFKNAIDEGKTIHLCGIGGVSMRALARLLQNMGAHVQGSDRDHSPAVAKLRQQGITVFIGHVAEQLGDAALVIRTAAVPDTNPEIEEARRRGLPVLERAQAWGLLMNGYRHAVCVSGTHGKTSTTSMLTEVLLCAHADPTVMVGGDLPMIGGSLRIGGNDLFVAEACEYRNSFLSFLPTIAILLNIQRDHLDFFKGMDDIIASFHRFACLVPQQGALSWPMVRTKTWPRPLKAVAGGSCALAWGSNGTYIPPMWSAIRVTIPLISIASANYTAGPHCKCRASTT